MNDFNKGLEKFNKDNHKDQIQRYDWEQLKKIEQEEAAAKIEEDNLNKAVLARKASVKRMSAFSQFKMNSQKLYAKSQSKRQIDNMNGNFGAIEKIGWLGEPVYKTAANDLQKYKTTLE